MADRFIPAGAPIHRQVLSRMEAALAARRNVLEIIPALAYRQPIMSGEMLMRWHMLADPGGDRPKNVFSQSTGVKGWGVGRAIGVPREITNRQSFAARGPRMNWPLASAAVVHSRRCECVA
jgi:hypothetical protein